MLEVSVRWRDRLAGVESFLYVTVVSIDDIFDRHAGGH